MMTVIYVGKLVRIEIPRCKWSTAIVSQVPTIYSCSSGKIGSIWNGLFSYLANDKTASTCDVCNTQHFAHYLVRLPSGLEIGVSKVFQIPDTIYHRLAVIADGWDPDMLDQL